MTITGTTQTAIDKLKAALDSHFPKVLAEAIETETAPFKSEAESLKAEMNKTNDDANARSKEDADKLAAVAQENLSLKDQVAALSREESDLQRQVADLNDKLSVKTGTPSVLGKG